jgi:hypothetical protein
MTNDEAKLVLSVYRPNGEDASDSFFAEALQQARRDPSLAAWLQEQQQFDTAMAADLRSVTAPSDAKAMIKASMGASTGRRRRWWPALLVAASVAVLLTSFWGLNRQDAGLPLPEQASVAQLATYLAEHHASMGLMSHDFARVRQWIAERGGPLPEDLPPGLVRMNVLGCQTWDTSRGKVSLVCFVGAGRQVLHLYVFENAAAHPGLPGLASPRLQQEGQWSFALWQHEGRAYVLGSPDDSDLSLASLFLT